VLVLQGRAGRGGCRGVAGEAPFDGVAAERAAVAGREEGITGLSAAFGEPAAEHARGGRGERRDPLFASFPLLTELGVDLSVLMRRMDDRAAMFADRDLR
jgi:hypothetical protein